MNSKGKTIRRGSGTLALVVACGLVLTGCQSMMKDGMQMPSAMERADADETTYEVTVMNLTTGQPFSPGIVVTHAAGMSLFQMGARPSPGLIKLAEDGMPMDAIMAMKSMSGVGEAVVLSMPMMPIHRRGGPGPTSATVRINAGPGETHLSLATMLVCTNDGFTGVSSMALPTDSTPASMDVGAYDAGSEVNDERFVSIVDSCGKVGPVMAPPDGNNNNLAEDGGVVRDHPGITGTGNLTAAHRWTGPVARITVRRMR